MADDVIRVEVLGTPRILKNGVETSFSRKRVRALLFYLATELKPVPRTTLAWLFWPDKSPQVASRNLSIHLSYLKNALSEDAVISSQGTIALAEDVESDARDYFAFANNPNRNGDHNPLGLFRGPFLHGFSIKDADPFDQWVSSEAQQWRNRSIDAALERSFDLEIQKRYTDALTTIERAISENEIREDLYRRAMSIMEKAGMRAQVGELYRELTTRLNDELGLPPLNPNRGMLSINHRVQRFIHRACQEIGATRTQRKGYALHRPARTRRPRPCRAKRVVRARYRRNGNRQNPLSQRAPAPNGRTAHRRKIHPANA